MSKKEKTKKTTDAVKKQPLQVAFDGGLEFEIHLTEIKSDPGLLACRELDAPLGLAEPGNSLLNDYRPCMNTQHSMVAVMRHRISSPLAKPWQPQGCCVHLREKTSIGHKMAANNLLHRNKAGGGTPT